MNESTFRLFRVVFAGVVLSAFVSACTYLPFDFPTRVGDVECEVDFDCRGRVEGRSTCDATGTCVVDDVCSHTIGCLPLACDAQTGFCGECGPDAPCLDGTVCSNNGRCKAPLGFADTPDFELDVFPIFERGDCLRCHSTATPQVGTDLVFDVSPDELYDQLRMPDLERVVTNAPLASSIVTKPLPEDPPDHADGPWDVDSPEIAILVRWIRAGAPPGGECRNVRMSTGEFVDCYDQYRPENYCEDYIANGDETRVRWECPECDARLGTPPDGVTCL